MLNGWLLMELIYTHLNIFSFSFKHLKEVFYDINDKIKAYFLLPLYISRY